MIDRKVRLLAPAAVGIAALALAACGSGSGNDGGNAGQSQAAQRTPSQPLKVQVTYPSDGTEVDTKTVKVRGTVTPAGASVAVLGQPAKVANGSFAAKVRLADMGDNPIDVVATKAGLAPGNATVTVARTPSQSQLAAQRTRRNQRAKAAAHRRAERKQREKAASQTTVPDLTGKRLDVAKDDLRGEGLRAKVIGGGTFGVVVESNWTVCSTTPGAGTSAEKNDKVRLIIDRVC